MAEPGGTGPIGPYPPGVHGADAETDYDRMRRRLLWTMPSGLFVVGSRAGDERNLMTLNWCTQVSFDPKLIGVGIERSAFTHGLVESSGRFTVNFIARDDRAIVRKFTKPVEVDLDAMTLNGFAFHEGVSGTPILDLAVSYLDCEVRQAVQVGGHTFFIGEVVDAGFQLSEDTEILRMEDTRMNYGG